MTGMIFPLPYVDSKDIVTEPVPIKHVPPQRGYWEVRVHYHDKPDLFLKEEAYDDQGNLRYDSYEATPEVAEWLRVNAPGVDLMMDCGDWGEGGPDMLLRFKRKKHATTFVMTFNATRKTIRHHR